MNVLEKILEEIDTIKKEYDNEKYHQYFVDGANCAISDIRALIRSQMDDVPDINVGKWIPVNERLPKVPEWTEDEDCPEFNVTIKGADKATTLKYAPDGTWFDDSGEVYKVIAWQPLPEVYREEK